MIPQMTATISADQLWPTRWDSAHQSAMDRNSATMWPAYPAPPSIPAPLPALLACALTSSVALVASAFISALASSSSWRISVDRSRVTSPINAPTEVPDVRVALLGNRLGRVAVVLLGGGGRRV